MKKKKIVLISYEQKFHGN